MPAPNLTAADFAQALQALLPPGRVWPRDPDATQSKVMAGLAGVYARQTLRANFLLADGFPARTTELLPEWEESLGLPDPCTGSSPSIGVRRAQVVARFTNSGGQSVAYFIAIAAALGFTVQIEQLTPFCAGLQRCGDPVGDEGWAYVWRMYTEDTQVSNFECGLAACGDPLRSWGNAVLECEINAIAPAHTIVLYALDPAGDLLLEDGGYLLLEDGSTHLALGFH